MDLQEDLLARRVVYSRLDNINHINTSVTSAKATPASSKQCILSMG